MTHMSNGTVDVLAAEWDVQRLLRRGFVPVEEPKPAPRQRKRSPRGKGQQWNGPQSETS